MQINSKLNSKPYDYLYKFLEILTTESGETDKFLQKHSISMFQKTVHVLHLTGFFNNKEKFDVSDASARVRVKTVFGNLTVAERSYI